MNEDELVSKVREMFTKERFDFPVVSIGFPKSKTDIKTDFILASQGKINTYPNGVMSVVMEKLSYKIPPTFGYLPEGDFKFNTGPNQETLHFLLGNLLWGVKGKGFVAPKQYNTLIIPAGKDLILKVIDPSLYICHYQKMR
jgi:uncharacterized protein YaiE (UPF0345 family)